MSLKMTTEKFARRVKQLRSGGEIEATGEVRDSITFTMRVYYDPRIHQYFATVSKKVWVGSQDRWEVVQSTFYTFPSFRLVVDTADEFMVELAEESENEYAGW